MLVLRLVLVLGLVLGLVFAVGDLGVRRCSGIVARADGGTG